MASAGGEGGYGSAASQVPVRQRSFLYPAFLPQSDGQDRKTMDAMDEQPLHLQRDMTHGTFRRYLEARKELAELASVLIVGVDGNSLINLHAGCEKPDSAILAQAFKNGMASRGRGGGVWGRACGAASARSGGV